MSAQFSDKQPLHCSSCQAPTIQIHIAHTNASGKFNTEQHVGRNGYFVVYRDEDQFLTVARTYSVGTKRSGLENGAHTFSFYAPL